jgi:hypothetical protein
MQGAPPGQTVPQEPQLRLFVSRSTQAFPHSVSPAAVLHWPVHTPALQSVPGAQRRPHIPQSAVAFCVSTQAVPQSVSPAPHEHMPPEQFAPVAHG